MKKIIVPLLLTFFLGGLFFPGGISLAGLSCAPPTDVEFCLRSPTDEQPGVAVNTDLVWDHTSIPNLDHFVLQIHELNTPFISFNVPPTTYCDGDVCSVPVLALSTVGFTLEDGAITYEWQVVAESEGRSELGNSQAWEFTTEQAPVDLSFPQCSDLLDNDGDTLTDHPQDPGCASADDDDESDGGGGGGGGIRPEDLNPISSTNLIELLENVLNFLFAVSIVVLPIMIVYGGFLLLTAAGDPEKISKARVILLWAVIAFAIILVARGLPPVLRGLL